METILGADPGNKGGFVWLDLNGKIVDYLCMPMGKTNKSYEKPELDYDKLREILLTKPYLPKFIICELPTSYGMLPASAFHYGYNFALLSRALETYRGTKNVHYVKPQDWTKELHIGLEKELKAKAKSKIVFEKLFSWESFGKMNKAAREGLMDACLMAEYGRRNLTRYDTLSST